MEVPITDKWQKTFILNDDGTYSLRTDAELSISPEVSTETKYEFMGKQTSGNYVYYGFKENGGGEWVVKRKDTTDESAWAFVYGGSEWSTAWADPTLLSYGDPPDS